MHKEEMDEKRKKMENEQEQSKKNKWRSRLELRTYFPKPMLQILNINTFIGLYNLEYFSAAVLVSLMFKTPFIHKPRNETGASGLYTHHTD
jgi:hypothetical protein